VTNFQASLPVRVHRPRPAPAAWDIDRTRLLRLQVILKTIERCNINCSYCYYFNGGDRSWEARPATLADETADAAVRFLADGARDLKIPEVEVIFHGGEPMMQSRRRFDRLCRQIRAAFENHPSVLRLAMQTNGTLVDEEWCQLLDEHQVSVGVSLDGPKAVNDIYRVDHHGRSTYEATAEGLRTLQRYQATHGATFGLGSLTVIDPRHDYADIYRHFVDELGLRRVGFLLPDCSHDTFAAFNAPPERFGQVLVDLFEAWRRHPVADVTNLSRTLDFYRAGSGPAMTSSSAVAAREAGLSVVGNQVIVIHGDGAVAVDDTLMPALGWWNNERRAHVSGTSLREFLKRPFFGEIQHATRTLPETCTSCTWQNVCHGGDVENRFSLDDGFARRSVFCEGLAMYHAHVKSYLAVNGYPPDVFSRKLAPRLA
jgi:uncharacterized protein